MDHSTKQNVVDVAQKIVGVVTAFILGKKAYKEYKKRSKKE